MNVLHGIVHIKNLKILPINGVRTTLYYYSVGALYRLYLTTFDERTSKSTFSFPNGNEVVDEIWAEYDETGELKIEEKLLNKIKLTGIELKPENIEITENINIQNQPINFIFCNDIQKFENYESNLYDICTNVHFSQWFGKSVNAVNGNGEGYIFTSNKNEGGEKEPNIPNLADIKDLKYDKLIQEKNLNIFIQIFYNSWKTAEQLLLKIKEAEEEEGKGEDSVNYKGFYEERYKCIQKVEKIKEDCAEFLRRKEEVDRIDAAIGNAERIVTSFSTKSLPSSEFQISNSQSFLLKDLRNLNYQNFRGYFDSYEEGEKLGKFKEFNNLARIAVDAKTSNKSYMRSPSRSYIKGQDFMFADTFASYNSDSTNPFKPEIQPLILNEFQPNEMITPADLLGPFLDVIMVGISKICGPALITPVMKVGGKFVTNNQIDKYSKNTWKLYRDNTGFAKKKENKDRKRGYFTSDPVEIIMNMFGNGGKWLNTYELPYYGNDYISWKYSNKWKTGDASTFLGTGLAGSDEAIGLKMFGIDFPANPKFTASMGPTRKEIVSEFYLINKNDDWLIKNFKFLNAIYAGTNWLHLKYGIIRPPNVYHVLCPGRFQIYWAAMDCEITFEGKLRKNINVSNILQTFTKSVDKDMLWPDAWKVKFTIKDLTPNNFNLYADYYLNGFERDALTQYENSQTLENAVKDLLTYIQNTFKSNPEEGSTEATIKKQIFGEHGDARMAAFNIINTFKNTRLFTDANEYSGKKLEPIIDSMVQLINKYTNPTGNK